MRTANPATEVLDVTDVVALLRDLIASKDLKGDDRLPSIRELAIQFGVKAGTVRDALRDAQGKGLVRVLHRVGAIVQCVDDSKARRSNAADLSRQFGEAVGQQDQNLFHILETRETLEMTMVARAAQRRELSELFRLRQILADMADIPLVLVCPA